MGCGCSSARPKKEPAPVRGTTWNPPVRAAQPANDAERVIVVEMPSVARGASGSHEQARSNADRANPREGEQSDAGRGEEEEDESEDNPQPTGAAYECADDEGLAPRLRDGQSDPEPTYFLPHLDIRRRELTPPGQRKKRESLAFGPRVVTPKHAPSAQDGDTSSRPTDSKPSMGTGAGGGAGASRSVNFDSSARGTTAGRRTSLRMRMSRALLAARVSSAFGVDAEGEDQGEEDDKDSKASEDDGGDDSFTRDSRPSRRESLRARFSLSGRTSHPLPPPSAHASPQRSSGRKDVTPSPAPGDSTPAASRLSGGTSWGSWGSGGSGGSKPFSTPPRALGDFSRFGLDRSGSSFKSKPSHTSLNSRVATSEPPKERQGSFILGGVAAFNARLSSDGGGNAGTGTGASSGGGGASRGGSGKSSVLGLGSGSRSRKYEHLPRPVVV